MFMLVDIVIPFSLAGGFAGAFLRPHITFMVRSMMSQLSQTRPETVPSYDQMQERRRPSEFVEDWHNALIQARHTSNIDAGYPPYHEVNGRILRLEDRERIRTQGIE
jgi:hypothetical protein